MSISSFQVQRHELGLCHSFPAEPRCLTFGPGNRLIAVGCSDGKLIILGRNQLKREYKHLHSSLAVERMSFGGDRGGCLVTVLKNDPSLHFWKWTDENLVYQNALPVPSIASKPLSRVTCLNWYDGSWFVGTNVGTVEVASVKKVRPAEAKKECENHKEGDDHQSLINDDESGSRGDQGGTDGAARNDVPTDSGFVFTGKLPTSSISRDRGKVVAIQEQPSGSADRKNMLVVFSGGLVTVWEQEKNRLIIHTEMQEPIAAWWIKQQDKNRNDHQFCVAFRNGLVQKFTYWTTSPHNIAAPEKLYYVYAQEDAGKLPKTQVRLLQHNLGATTAVYYSGACPVLPDGSSDEHVISYISEKKKLSMPLMPFGSRIIDFVYTSKLDLELQKKALIVLTRDDLVILSVEKSKLDKEEKVNLLCFPHVSGFNGYPHIISPVTCLQHCGACSDNLIEFLGQGLETEGETDLDVSSEFVVTGHKDGSVHMWICTYDTVNHKLTSFKLVYVVYTTHYFSLDKKTVTNNDDRKVSVVKVTRDQKHLLVVNGFGHLLLFKFCPLNSQLLEVQPQSQEVILKEQIDDSPTQSISMPAHAPHLHSCNWQPCVQLLQHFSCFYQQIIESGEQLEVVPVNCVDYIEDELAKMLAIGVDKGLIVLDTDTNQLIEVFGSEKKLLGKSGRADRSELWGSDGPSDSECIVTCVETARITFKQSSQLTLWVGTARGSLGVFTVTKKDGEPLQLEKTGEGRQKNSAIISIELLQIPATPEQIDYENTVAFMAEDSTPTTDPVPISTPILTTYAVVTTEKQVKCYIHSAEKTEKKEGSNINGDFLASGILQISASERKFCKPYLVCLLKTGKVNIYSLPNVKMLSDKLDLGLPEDTINDKSKKQFSSNGSFTVSQFSSENLELITCKGTTSEV